MAIGLIIGLYGAFKDYEPATLIGALLMVAGSMLLVWINFNKE